MALCAPLNEARRETVKQARKRADRECQRAQSEQQRAADSEARAASAPSRARHHTAMAAIHRQAEQRHRVAARVHLAHAQRLEYWARHEATQQTEPGLMAAVAVTAGADSATLNLLGPTPTADAMVAASDETSRHAYYLKTVFAEGPVHEALRLGSPIVASDSTVATRWPHYGPAVRELGVQSVAAVDLRPQGRSPLGALTAYNLHDSRSDIVAQELSGIADALLHRVLLTADAITDDDCEVPTVALLDRDDFQALLHQAAGKIHADSECSIDAAFSLLRAHAMAEGRSISDVARDVLHDRLTLP